MAFREVTMLEVKEVLRLWLMGVPRKGIAQQLGSIAALQHKTRSARGGSPVEVSRSISRWIPFPMVR
jgi:hypothetical protein